MSSTPTRLSPFSKLESLEDFKPKPPSENVAAPTETSRVVAKSSEKSKLAKLAVSEGFTINNFDVEPLPARIENDDKKTFLKTIRIHVADWNKFQTWCHENRYTHKKGFEALTETLPEQKR